VASGGKADPKKEKKVSVLGNMLLINVLFFARSPILKRLTSPELVKA
jgi:hypothetical protein